VGTWQLAANEVLDLFGNALLPSAGGRLEPTWYTPKPEHDLETLVKTIATVERPTKYFPLRQRCLTFNDLRDMWDKVLRPPDWQEALTLARRCNYVGLQQWITNCV